MTETPCDISGLPIEEQRSLVVSAKRRRIESLLAIRQNVATELEQAKALCDDKDSSMVDDSGSTPAAEAASSSSSSSGTQKVHILTPEERERRRNQETANVCRQVEEQIQAGCLAPEEGTTWSSLLRKFKNMPDALLSVQERALERVSRLQELGLWAPSLPPRQADPHRQKVHWDFMLSEMAWMASDFSNERHWKQQMSRAFVHECAAIARQRAAEKRKNYVEKRKLAWSIAEAVLQSPIWGCKKAVAESTPKLQPEQLADTDNPFRNGSFMIPGTLSTMQQNTLQQLKNSLSSHRTCVLHDQTGLAACKIVCTLMASSHDVAPCIFILSRSAKLRWWFSLQAAMHHDIPFYDGGNPSQPRLLLVTSCDVAAAESLSLGSIKWSSSVIVADNVDDSIAATPLWSKVCQSVANADSRLIVCNSATPRVLASAFIDSAKHRASAIGTVNINRCDVISKSKKAQQLSVFVHNTHFSDKVQESYNSILSDVCAGNGGDELRVCFGAPECPGLSSSFVTKSVHNPPNEFVSTLFCDKDVSKYMIVLPKGISWCSHAMNDFNGKLGSVSGQVPMPSVLSNLASLAPPRALIAGEEEAVAEQVLPRSNEMTFLLSNPPKFTILRKLLNEKRVVIVAQNDVIGGYLLAWLRTNYSSMTVFNALSKNETLVRSGCLFFDCNTDPFSVLVVPPISAGFLADRVCVTSIILFDFDMTVETLSLLHTELRAMATLSVENKVDCHLIQTENTHECLSSLLLSDSEPTPQVLTNALDGFCEKTNNSPVNIRDTFIRQREQPKSSLVLPLTDYAIRTESWCEQDDMDSSSALSPLESEDVMHSEVPSECICESPVLMPDDWTVPDVVYSSVCDKEALTRFFAHEEDVGYPFLEYSDELYVPELDRMDGQSLVVSMMNSAPGRSSRKKRKEKERRRFQSYIDPRQEAESLYMPPLENSEQDDRKRTVEPPPPSVTTAEQEEQVFALKRRRLEEQQQQQQQQQHHQQQQQQQQPVSRAQHSVMIRPPSMLAQSASIWTAEMDRELQKLCKTENANWRYISDRIRELSERRISKEVCAERFSILQQRPNRMDMQIYQTASDLAGIVFQRWQVLSRNFDAVEAKTRAKPDSTEPIEQFLERTPASESHQQVEAKARATNLPSTPSALVPVIYSNPILYSGRPKPQPQSNPKMPPAQNQRLPPNYPQNMRMSPNYQYYPQQQQQLQQQQLQQQQLQQQQQPQQQHMVQQNMRMMNAQQQQLPYQQQTTIARSPDGSYVQQVVPVQSHQPMVMMQQQGMQPMVGQPMQMVQQNGMIAAQQQPPIQQRVLAAQQQPKPQQVTNVGAPTTGRGGGPKTRGRRGRRN